jgi:hypothetical protein
MSVSSISTWAWPQPYQPPSPATPSGTGSGSVTAPTSSGSVVPASNQQLAADVLARSAKSQKPDSGVSVGISSAPVTRPASLGGDTGSISSSDQVAQDIQAIHSQIQASTTSAALSATSPAVDQAHPHRLDQGGNTVPAGSAGGVSGSSPAISSTTGPYSLQNVSQSIAADILQALQSYGNLTSTTQTPGVTA